MKHASYIDAHGRTWMPADDGRWREVVTIEGQLLRDIISTIDNFDEGDDIEIDFANDGEDHWDFMGFTIKAPGRDKLKELIDKAVRDIRTLDRDHND